MTIQRFPPNTIHLGGDQTIVADVAASEAITPGMLVERFASGTTNRWRKSTLTGAASRAVALDHSMANAGVDTAYAASDLVEVGIQKPGSVVWGLIASGANIAFGAPLSDAGNGYFKAASGVTIAQALEKVDNSAGPTAARIRVEFL